MTCENHRQAIQELVDGTLGAIRRAELEQHLSQCEACQQFEADMRRIRDLAGSLDTMAPPDGVWLQVAGRLRQEGRVQAPPPLVRPAPHRRYAILAIAASLIVAVGASLMFLFPMFGARTGRDAANQTGTEATADTVKSVEDDFRLAEQHLQSGIAKLRGGRAHGRVDDRSTDRRHAEEEPRRDRSGDCREPGRAQFRAAEHASPETACSRRCGARSICCRTRSR